MESIKISSVDLSSLSPLGNTIQLEFEGYFADEDSSYPCFLSLDTASNLAVKHEGCENESIKYAFTKDNAPISLYPNYDDSGDYDGTFFVTGTKEGEEWSAEDGTLDTFRRQGEAGLKSYNDTVNLSTDEIKLLANVFTPSNVYNIIQDVIGITNNQS
jgi:hypothetical protein